ncbi:MAG: hypothetical protein KAS72_12225 [Phycisphaerales bacterium]|nr:hypothetical protein [Phycisphaerales bacterium]
MRPIQPLLVGWLCVGSAVFADGSHGLYVNIPTTGPMPVVVTEQSGPGAEAQHIRRADQRRLEQELKRIRGKHFRRIKNDAIRREGIEQFTHFTDPIVFESMIEILEGEAMDVQYGLVRHFQNLANPSGDAALAWMALEHSQQEPAALATEALLDRVDANDGRVGDTVRRLVESHIRSNVHARAAAGAQLAQQLALYEMIPVMIISQVAQQRTGGGQGDLAYIAIATQRAFVADLQPVVGDNVVGFDPQIGVVSEGVVLRIRDMVVQVYRYDVHNALVGMTTDDWGESTADMGFDIKAWRTWYETQYRPYKLAQLEAEQEAQQQDDDAATAVTGS